MVCSTTPARQISYALYCSETILEIKEDKHACKFALRYVIRHQHCGRRFFRFSNGITSLNSAKIRNPESKQIAYFRLLDSD